ncbi:hypothetical protein JCM10908_005886 [Rhodotorula pacifica]|uniref:SGNH/GDSL hydrolase family protein n=1 Tax=Rhodotorula pacifica TaxID=1495444 RepID=UPI0031829F5A
MGWSASTAREALQQAGTSWAATTTTRRPSLLRFTAISLVFLFTVFFFLPQSYYEGRSSLFPYGSRTAADQLLVRQQQSCEVCHLDPFDPLCEYGEHNIRLSRAFEGSGFRLQRALKKILAGEEVNIGVLGASITQGHSVPPGNQIWQDRWFEDFGRRYPNVKMHVGAVGATDSQFFSYCFPALLPVNDIDLVLVELDVNNEPGLQTLKDDDALMRGLLQLPKEPAVVRISFFTITFSELGRGTLSTLITSQFFDVPVISIRNFLLPQTIKNRESAEVIFGLDQWGNRDYRHVSEVGHKAMADMLTLFLRKEICEVERRATLPPSKVEMTGPWWKEEDLGSVPDITIYESWKNPLPPRIVMPYCHSTLIPRSPLVPLSHSDSFELITWNGKSAWASSEPGAQIRMSFTGTTVRVFVYAMPGRAEPSAADGEASAHLEEKKKEEEEPGSAYCWIEEVGQYEREQAEDKAGMTTGRRPEERIEWLVNTHWPDKPASGTEIIELAEGLPPGEHVLACEVANETTSGGHKWRLQAIASL